MGLPVDTLKVLKILSVMCVPLIYRSQILGAIYVDSLERPYAFAGKTFCSSWI